jgi:hypothetical protein
MTSQQVISINSDPDLNYFLDTPTAGKFSVIETVTGHRAGKFAIRVDP